MVISVTYATNISSAGVHLAKFTPFLPHFNKNCLEKFFFRRPGGGAPAPPAPPLATPMTALYVYAVYPHFLTVSTT